MCHMGAGASAASPAAELDEDGARAWQGAAAPSVPFDGLAFRRMASQGAIARDELESKGGVALVERARAVPRRDALALALSAERVAWQLEDGDAPTATPLGGAAPRAPALAGAPLPNVAPEDGAADRAFELLADRAAGAALALAAPVALGGGAEDAWSLALWLKPRARASGAARALVADARGGCLVCLVPRASGRFALGARAPGDAEPTVAALGGGAGDGGALELAPGKWQLIVAVEEEKHDRFQPVARSSCATARGWQPGGAVWAAASGA